MKNGDLGRIVLYYLIFVILFSSFMELDQMEKKNSQKFHTDSPTILSKPSLVNRQLWSSNTPTLTLKLKYA